MFARSREVGRHKITFYWKDSRSLSCGLINSGASKPSKPNPDVMYIVVRYHFILNVY